MGRLQFLLSFSLDLTVHAPVEQVNNAGTTDQSLCTKEPSVAKREQQLEQHQQLGDTALYFILFLNQHRCVS